MFNDLDRCLRFWRCSRVPSKKNSSQNDFNCLELLVCEEYNRKNSSSQTLLFSIIVKTGKNEFHNENVILPTLWCNCNCIWRALVYFAFIWTHTHVDELLLLLCCYSSSRISTYIECIRSDSDFIDSRHTNARVARVSFLGKCLFFLLSQRLRVAQIQFILFTIFIYYSFEWLQICTWISSYGKLYSRAYCLWCSFSWEWERRFIALFQLSLNVIHCCAHM